MTSLRGLKPRAAKLDARVRAQSDCSWDWGRRNFNTWLSLHSGFRGGFCNFIRDRCVTVGDRQGVENNKKKHTYSTHMILFTSFPGPGKTSHFTLRMPSRDSLPLKEKSGTFDSLSIDMQNPLSLL